MAIKLSNLLLQYPAGLTEAIVLTELESQVRVSLQRHVTKKAVQY